MNRRVCWFHLFALFRIWNFILRKIKFKHPRNLLTYDTDLCLIPIRHQSPLGALFRIRVWYLYCQSSSQAQLVTGSACHCLLLNMGLLRKFREFGRWGDGGSMKTILRCTPSISLLSTQLFPLRFSQCFLQTTCSLNPHPLATSP